MDHHDVLRPVRKALKKFESERVDTPTEVEARWTFPVEINEDPDDGGYVGRAVGLPGCWAQGETVDEVTRNLQDAVDSVLAVRLRGVLSDGLAPHAAIAAR